MLYLPHMTKPSLWRPGHQVQGNLFWIARRYGRRHSRIFAGSRQQNMVLDQGLDALAYNAVAGNAANGGQVKYIAWSTNGTAPVATDTTLAGEILKSKMIGGGVDPAGLAYWRFKLPRDVNDELGSPSVNGSTIRKIGLYTHDSGNSRPSDDKLIAAALLDVPVAKDSDTEIEGIWMLSFAPVVSSNELWYVLWRKFLASCLVDLSTYGVLDHVAFGTGLVGNPPDPTEQALGAEQYREIPETAWSASSNTISCTGTVKTTEYSASTLTEFGPAIGTNPGGTSPFVLARKDGVSVDMTTATGNYSISIDINRA